MAEICKHCKAEAALNYCPACGRPVALKRIDGQYMLDEIRVAFSFEKGFLFTIRELAVNPGKSIKDFLHEDRGRLIRPIVFLIITSLMYSVVNNIFHFEDGYVQFSGEKSSTAFAIFEWIQQNYGYANIIMAVFIALWVKWLFKKYGFNYFEILILLCFAMGMGMLIFSVFAIVEGLTRIELTQVSGIAGLLYLTYAIGQFFDKAKPKSYLKAFIAYMMGLITFSVLAVVIGMMIDFAL